MLKIIDNDEFNDHEFNKLLSEIRGFLDQSVNDFSQLSTKTLKEKLKSIPLNVEDKNSAKNIQELLAYIRSYIDSTINEFPIE